MPRRKLVPPPQELVTLPERLKYARTRRKLTLEKVAEAAEADPSQVSRLERGVRVGGVEAATLIRLSRALGVPVGWLVADEGAAPPVPVFVEETDRRRRKPRGT